MIDEQIGTCQNHRNKHAEPHYVERQPYEYQCNGDNNRDIQTLIESSKIDMVDRVASHDAQMYRSYLRDGRFELTSNDYEQAGHEEDKNSGSQNI